MTIRLLIGGLLLASQLLVRAETTSAHVQSIQGGDAYVISPDGKSQKITTATMIAPGSVIHTGSGTVGLHLMPGANTVVAPDSDVTVSSLDYSKDASGAASRTVVLDLRKGTVFNTLAHDNGVSDFRIKTPKGVAAARGTDWSVSVIGKEVSIKVLHGNIVFISFGIRVNIPGGHGFSTVTNIVVILTPQEIAEIVKALNDAGFTVSVTVNGQTTVYPGNPSNTTSSEQ
jgi:hypothetical protein